MTESSTLPAGTKFVNEHGVITKRTCVMNQHITQIPDLRPGLDSPTSNRPQFQGLFFLQEYF